MARFIPDVRFPDPRVVRPTNDDANFLLLTQRQELVHSVPAPVRYSALPVGNSQILPRLAVTVFLLSTG